MAWLKSKFIGLCSRELARQGSMLEAQQPTWEADLLLQQAATLTHLNPCNLS